MVKNRVNTGSTVVTNEVLYPLLHNISGIGEIVSTEALMNLDRNHDQKSLKNLGKSLECSLNIIFFYD